MDINKEGLGGNKMETLAVKYRPSVFAEVIGQESIKQILQDQISTKTHKNCYLFTGGAGTGKTTCARIFANEINNGKGSFIEIDAASNNGVDNVREIIDNAKYKSLDSEYKIYIIDECHMLSTGAWNAMLKILEEPPAKTVFILCTTDPQKIPNTILSRVQRYDFQRISLDGIISRLEYIINCENEQARYDKDGNFI
jgi:DNA polymerase-3 subunit gamma/tau